MSHVRHNVPLTASAEFGVACLLLSLSHGKKRRGEAEPGEAGLRWSFVASAFSPLVTLPPANPRPHTQASR